MNRAAALALVDQARQALTEAGITDVALMTSTDRLGTELDAGQAGVLVMAPRVEYETYHAATATWEVVLVAPEWDRLDDAWDRLDDLLHALRLALDVDTATPTGYQAPQGRIYPAYSLELTTEHDL